MALKLGQVLHKIQQISIFFFFLPFRKKFAVTDKVGTELMFKSFKIKKYRRLLVFLVFATKCLVVQRLVPSDMLVIEPSVRGHFET